ncbi:hypothetical protein D9M71_665340 [compost metagenome]
MHLGVTMEVRLSDEVQLDAPLNGEHKKSEQALTHLFHGLHNRTSNLGHRHLDLQVFDGLHLVQSLVIVYQSY